MYRKLEDCEIPPEVAQAGEFQDLIKRCCRPSPHDRITATELLEEL